MKKLIIWLAKVFKINLEKIVYRDKLVALDGDIKGTVYIDGNLIVSGTITVTGEVTAYAIKKK